MGPAVAPVAQEVVAGGQQHLLPPHARRHGHHVEQLDLLVHVDRVVPFAGQGRHPAADVAGERLHVFQGDQLHGPIAREPGQSLEIDLGVGRNHGQQHAVAVAPGHQGFEDLLGRQSDVAGHPHGTQVVGVGLVLAHLVADAERVEDAHGVGFHGANRLLNCKRHPVSATRPSLTLRVPPQTVNATAGPVPARRMIGSYRGLARNASDFSPLPPGPRAAAPAFANRVQLADWSAHSNRRRAGAAIRPTNAPRAPRAARSKTTPKRGARRGCPNVANRPAPDAHRRTVASRPRKKRYARSMAAVACPAGGVGSSSEGHRPGCESRPPPLHFSTIASFGPTGQPLRAPKGPNSTAPGNAQGMERNRNTTRPNGPQPPETNDAGTVTVRWTFEHHGPDRFPGRCPRCCTQVVG